MAQATNLKAWMRSINIYDKDVEPILSEQGINDPSVDFKTYTQAQWDELYRRAVVARAKELKDSAAKSRLEKKMAKLEKFWRTESGIKKTSIKKGGKKGKKKKKGPANSASVNNEALASSKKLKKYLQNNGCFDKDLLVALSNADIHSEEDIPKIESNSAWDEIKRQVTVARAAELKDAAAKSRLEKNLTKFEKLWRAATGIKRTAQTKKTKKGKKKKAPKDAANDTLTSGDGKELKKWLRDNNIWEKELFAELLANNIKCQEDLNAITENKFDTIVRKVRVDRFSQLKDNDARNRADKLLVKFEKIWRKTTGITKTSIQNNDEEKDGNEEENNDNDNGDADNNDNENDDAKDEENGGDAAAEEEDDGGDAAEDDGGDNNDNNEEEEEDNGGGGGDDENNDGAADDDADADANADADADGGGDADANADDADANADGAGDA